MTAYRTILVDTDGSDYSYRVVDHAAELAHVTHARLLIICARHDTIMNTTSLKLAREIMRSGPTEWCDYCNGEEYPFD